MRLRKRAETLRKRGDTKGKSLFLFMCGNARKRGDTMSRLLKNMRRRKRKHTPPPTGERALGVPLAPHRELGR